MANINSCTSQGRVYRFFNIEYLLKLWSIFDDTNWIIIIITVSLQHNTVGNIRSAPSCPLQKLTLRLSAPILTRLWLKYHIKHISHDSHRHTLPFNKWCSWGPEINNAVVFLLFADSLLTWLYHVCWYTKGSFYSLSPCRWITFVIYLSLDYNDVIMSTMASQITSPMIVYSTVYSRRCSKKTSKFRVTGLCGGIHRWPLNFSHNNHEGGDLVDQNPWFT